MFAAWRSAKIGCWCLTARSTRLEPRYEGLLHLAYNNMSESSPRFLTTRSWIHMCWSLEVSSIRLFSETKELVPKEKRDVRTCDMGQT